MDKKLFKSILWIITYSVLLVLFITKFDELRGLFGTVIGLFTPVFIGFGIAFVLNRPTHFFCSVYERGLRRTRVSKLARPLAVVTSYAVLFIAIVALFSVVLPKLADSIRLFLASLNGYLRDAQPWVNDLLSRLHLETLDFSKLNDFIRTALTGLINTLSNAVPQVVAFTGNIISIFVTGFLSIIFSIYMLSGKEKLLSQSRRVLRAYVPKRAADWLTDVVHLSADTFSAFVTGQLVEACILGGLTAVGMLFIQADYAPLVGVIISASALVPMVGAFVGAVLGAMVLVMVSPIKALIFLIFLLILQQFEGNVIYPRVVGTSIGLPAIWVLTAITLGGGLFQFVGILVSVPVASVIYTLMRRDVHKRLGERE